MVRHRDWYDPSVIRRVQRSINFVLWVLFLCMLYLNHGWLLTLLKNIFSKS